MNKLQILGLAGILTTNIGYAQTPTYDAAKQTYTYQAKEYNTKITNNLDRIAIELAKGKLRGTSNLPTNEGKIYLNRYKDGILENGEATQYKVTFKNNTLGIYDGGECLSYVKFTSKDPLENIVKILSQ